MAAVLRSTGGHALLHRQREHFGNEATLRDWSQLVETMLQWERWLRSTSMEKKHVHEARVKHRYIMYLMKKVTKCISGILLKLTKFHSVVHMADDIVNFGIPMEVDTGSNKSGHKATKTVACLMQKNEQTFDLQMAIRLEEVDLLDLAMLEIEHEPVFYHGQHMPQAHPKDPPLKENVPISGAKFTVKYDIEQQQNVVVLTSRATKDDGKGRLKMGLISFIADLQNVVQEYLEKVPLRTVHKCQGQIFIRGQNRYRGQVWRDSALIDWGTEGCYPRKSGDLWICVAFQREPMSFLKE
jgi:hypothetical protein